MRLRVATLIAAGCVCVASFLPAEFKSKPSAAQSLADALRGASRIELFALNPLLPEEREALTKGKRFHGYEALGSTVLNEKDETQSPELKSIVDAAANSLEVPPPNTGKGCSFVPRHGLRVTTGDRRIDLVVCLECGDIDSYPGKKRYWMKDKTKEKLRTTLNATLKKAGVPLADGSE